MEVVPSSIYRHRSTHIYLTLLFLSPPSALSDIAYICNQINESISRNQHVCNPIKGNFKHVVNSLEACKSACYLYYREPYPGLRKYLAFLSVMSRVEVGIKGSVACEAMSSIAVISYQQ